jgi:PTH1 family peptidyl-tRNA hydrolase
MNLSGQCIIQVVNWYKINLTNLIVIYDDIDIDEGKLRLRPKGSSGTHNGMKSVIYMLNSDQFPRIRIGIGKPPQNMELSNYVLSKIDGESKNLFQQIIKTAEKAVEEIIENGIDSAMNLYNK